MPKPKMIVKEIRASFNNMNVMIESIPTDFAKTEHADRRPIQPAVKWVILGRNYLKL
jgi:hypothetical protein